MPNPVYPTVKLYIDMDGDNLTETDISNRIVSNFSGQSGSTSNKETDRSPVTGNLSFQIKNYDGAYTNADQLVGHAIRVALVLGGKEKGVFYGYITKANIDPADFGNRKVSITVTDWVNIATNSKVKDIPLATFVTADEAIPTLLASTPNPPMNTDLEAGYERFPNMFDAALKNTVVFSEMDKIVKSELGRFYLQYRVGDDGETLKLENYLSRGSTKPVSSVPDNVTTPGFLKIHGNGGATGYLKFHGNGGTSGKIKLSQVQDAYFDRTMIDAEWDAGDNVVNRMSISTTPRKTDTSDQILFSLNAPIRLGSTSRFTLTGTWKDPNGGTVIAATDVVAPVPYTDFLINTKEDGTGTDTTGSLKKAFTWGANGFSQFFNYLGPTAYLIMFNVRGRGIYKYDPVELISESVDSQENVVRTVKQDNMTREYSANFDISKTFADSVIALDRKPRKVMKSVDFVANTSEHLMLAFMYLDIGSKVRIVESVPAHTGVYYIQGIKFNIARGGIVTFTWFLSEGAETICQPIAVQNATTAGGTRSAINFGILPYLNNLYEFSYSLWVKRTNTGPGCVLIGKSVDDGVVGRRGNYLLLNGSTLTFICHRSPTDGQWDLASAVTSTNVWVHILLVYDNRSYENDPKIYLNGVLQSITETNTPVGNYDDDSDCFLTLFNIGPDPAVDDQQYYYGTMRRTAMKNVRIYNRQVTAAEAVLLAAGPDDYSNVQDGLVFQGIYAPQDYVNDYIGSPITNEEFVIDTVHKATGIPYNETTTDATTMLGGLTP